MRFHSGKLCIVVLFLSIAPTGCSMNGLPMKAPSASSSIEAPPEVSADAVLSCAERAVVRLEKTDEQWDLRVTRKDIRSGILETGNFAEENESGFRVKVTFDPDTHRIDIVLKGAGAYFVDLGVDSAIDAFSAAMRECLPRSAGTPLG
ncbi:MAG: hypothetical protein HOP03_06580 [Lysobacter sp.]|nr:hypothetical protein [Lysobacter sp.]